MQVWVSLGQLEAFKQQPEGKGGRHQERGKAFNYSGPCFKVAPAGPYSTIKEAEAACAGYVQDVRRRLRGEQ